MSGDPQRPDRDDPDPLRPPDGPGEDDDADTQPLAPDDPPDPGALPPPAPGQAPGAGGASPPPPPGEMPGTDGPAPPAPGEGPAAGGGSPPPPPRPGDPEATQPPPPPPQDASGAGAGPPPPPPQPPATPPASHGGSQPYGRTATASPEARNWALAAHLSAFAVFVGIPWFVGPLVVWLIKRNDDPFIDAHGKEAVNFSLSMLIYGVALLVGGVIITVLTLGVAVILVIGLAAALVIGWFVLTILAAVKAANGEAYSYPLTLRLIQ